MTPHVLVIWLLVLCLSFVSAQPFLGFQGIFEIQPISTTSDTSLTKHVGTLYATFQPQIWHMEFDGGNPDTEASFILSNTRRWVSTVENFTREFPAEMTYYRDNEPSCCIQTPLFDAFEEPNVNEQIVIRFGGQQVLFKLTSKQGGILIDPTEWINIFDENNSGQCIFKCFAPVDVMFLSDASGSIDGISNGPNWNRIVDFIKDYKARYVLSEDGAHFGLAQFAGWRYENSPSVTPRRQDLICEIQAIPNSTDSSDWGIIFDDVFTSNAAKENWYNSPSCRPRVNGNWDIDSETENQRWGCLGRIPSDDDWDTICGPAWAMVEAQLTGYEDYYNYRLEYMSNVLQDWDCVPSDCSNDDYYSNRYTAIGHGILTSAQEMKKKQRGSQQILVTLTDGIPNKGISTSLGVVMARDLLNGGDAPDVRFVGVAVGDTDTVSPTVIITAAGGVIENTLRVDDFDSLPVILDRLVGISCDAEYDLCSSCDGLCNPCQECICPSCPNLECQTSLGCDRGICQYSDPLPGCCPANIVEPCERRGGILNEDCECVIKSGDDEDDTGVIVGSTIGTLVFLTLVALLLLLLFAGIVAIIVTVIILILKAQAIAHAFAALGANAFSGGGATANPTYTGTALEGENPLYNDD